MTRLDRLNSFLSERLSAALNEIIYTVSMTMKEYEEETVRIRKENEYLKEMLKITGCSVTEANPGVGFSLSSELKDCNTSLEQQSEPHESQNGHQRLKEENSSIKAKQLFNSAEPETKQICGIQPHIPEEPLRCTSLLNTQAVEPKMTDYEFPATIKVESVTSDSESDTTDSESDTTDSESDNTDDTDSMDSSTQSCSPQNWDMISDKNDQCKVQKAASQLPSTYPAESASHGKPVEFQAVFSYSNQIACNSKCTDSRQCTMLRAIGKSSPVWKYFSLKEGDCSKAVCLICKTVISRGIKEYKTSALLRHLRFKHGKC